MSVFDKFRKKFAPKAQDLTDADRRDLTSIRTHPGYQVLLNVMEQICQVAETELLKLDPVRVTTQQIAAQQSTARAQRIFFERVQKRIEYEINESLGVPQTHGDPDLDDPRTIERLLDPIGRMQ